MKTLLSGALLLAGLAPVVPAAASPGQCSVTGFDVFECDVNVDGGGITFALPDGRTFVFSHVAGGEGFGYVLPAESRPGALPQELGAFAPVEGEDGCWFGAKDEITFCVALVQ